MAIKDWFPFIKTSKPKASMALNSPEFLEFVRGGNSEASIQVALQNDAVLRAVDLITGSIGMLPFEIMQKNDKTGQVTPAVNHPMYNLLRYQPNPYQTAHEFKALMQGWLLMHGNAYARIVRTLGRVSSLIPVDPRNVSIETDGGVFPIRYRVTTNENKSIELKPSELLHLRGLSIDADQGISRVKSAGNIIQTAMQQQVAANNLYRNGMIAGVAFLHPTKLTPDAYERLKASLGNYSGASNAGRSVLLEEGMTREFPPATAQNAQMFEMGAQLTERIGRVFGVPRPLMFMDDTSWGSGIEQLAMLFVRFGLAPYFSIWEQAITRSCLSIADRGIYYPDYDERELLRGTTADQAEYLAKALGSGGHRPWMEVNEARDLVGLGYHKDGGGLIAAGEAKNEPAQVT
ncbi:MAG: phage portal protein [Ahrensia sp.]|nr:phage portal protein [Ahrensia sp.]